jgi:hypothetical protein
VRDDTEENAFELGGLVVKRGSGARKPSPAKRKAASENGGHHFARITKRHMALLATVSRPAVAWPLFSHLMLFSAVKASDLPFPLPIDDLVKETATEQKQLMRTLRDLVGAGLVRIERKSRYEPPLIFIPGTTKTRRRTT